MPALHYTHEDGVAAITLNNPPQNRFMGEMTVGLGKALADLAARDDTRVLLIDAEGVDFSHGGNVGGWIGQSEAEFSRGIAQGLKTLNIVESLPCPVIAAVQGYCGGGGFELAMRSDIILAADDARFCHSEATVAAFTFMGGVQRVAERVGRTRAIQWSMTAEEVDAQTALTTGLVNEVVPRAELAAAAERWVERFRTAPPSRTRRTRRSCAPGPPAASRRQTRSFLKWRGRSFIRRTRRAASKRLPTRSEWGHRGPPSPSAADERARASRSGPVRLTCSRSSPCTTRTGFSRPPSLCRSGWPPALRRRRPSPMNRMPMIRAPTIRAQRCRSPNGPSPSSRDVSYIISPLLTGETMLRRLNLQEKIVYFRTPITQIGEHLVLARSFQRCGISSDQLNATIRVLHRQSVFQRLIKKSISDWEASKYETP